MQPPTKTKEKKKKRIENYEQVEKEEKSPNSIPETMNRPKKFIQTLGSSLSLLQ